MPKNATTNAAQKDDLGVLPVWDLSDLYESPDCKALTDDLANGQQPAYIPPAAVASDGSGPGVVDVRALEWAVNPVSWAPDSTRLVAGVTSNQLESLQELRLRAETHDRRDLRLLRCGHSQGRGGALQ